MSLHAPLTAETRGLFNDDAFRRMRKGAFNRYSIGHVDRLPVDVVNKFEDLDRVQREWFDDQSRLDGLVHLGVNLRGIVQSDARVFHTEMQDMLSGWQKPVAKGKEKAHSGLVALLRLSDTLNAPAD